MDKQKILEMLNEKYGTNLNLRLEKLSEEYNELVETVEEVPMLFNDAPGVRDKGGYWGTPSTPVRLKKSKNNYHHEQRRNHRSIKKRYGD